MNNKFLRPDKMKKLSIHTITHVPYEGLGCIDQWIDNNNHQSGYTRVYEDHRFPDVKDIDWLIVMGGPMGVNDEVEFPWLVKEKAFIRKAIENRKTVIGICLGSQLIAEILGARVYPNDQKEIGWYDIKLTETAMKHPLFGNFEEQFPVFHWHGDTFDIPVGSDLLMSSDICVNQAFIYKKNVLGLQFHLEVTEHSLQGMIANGKKELVESNTIQSAEMITDQTIYIEENNLKMFQILDYFEQQSEDTGLHLLSEESVIKKRTNIH